MNKDPDTAPNSNRVWVHIIWKRQGQNVNELIGPVSRQAANAILIGLPTYENLLSGQYSPNGYAWRYWIDDKPEEGFIV